MIILFVAEYLPKNIFRINPNRSLTIFVFPLTVVYALLYPMVSVTINLSEFLLENVFGLEVKKENSVFTMIDLDNFLKEGTSKKEKTDEMDYEIQIFQNALDFSSVKARECMVPRTEIVALDVEQSIDDLKLKFLETRLSKILIYAENIDNIIGYVYCKELFKHPTTIKSILLPVSVVPESISASEVLKVFIKKHKSIMIVVDEFGGTSGMLTMEDVMEEIFGEIDDEHDKENMVERQIGDDEFLFSARLETDYVNSKYHLGLPSIDNVETLGGLVMHFYESIPKLNQQIVIENFVFTVTDVSSVRIEEMRLQVKKVEGE